MKTMIGEEETEKIRTSGELEIFRMRLVDSASSRTPRIVISSGTCGQARGSTEVVESFQRAIKKHDLQNKIATRVSGCGGFCETEPNAVIYPEGVFYQKLSPDDAEEIISETVLNGRIVDRLLYVDPNTGQKFVHESEIPFYKKQMRLLLASNLLIEPTSIQDYLSIGGYRTFFKVLRDLTPEQVIEEIKRSGLRGRGGAGFPTGMKWDLCRRARDSIKYVICNADEGDPGAYMDRSLLEGNPHSVIEGMMIGAYAIGASEGFIYVRSEYPLAVKHSKIAIEDARKHGLLGEDIAASGFRFDIRIAIGAGAFVCGEETALIASIEGKRGTPRQRPPFPVEKGLWGRPTNINNVETWANVPLILARGADWYSKIGTERSKGTKIFSLVGKIKNTGLCEVPMGTTLREMIYDIGGGVPDGKKFKAVQIGGPSGGCIPSELLDLPIDYESLTGAGSIMGSGGIIVLDEKTCVVDLVLYYISFLEDESCGKCVSCREGLHRMREILVDISEGRGKAEDIKVLEEVATVVKDASFCGLGQTAPNPVVSTLRYFRDEYLAHIRDRKCPAKVCRALIQYSIVEGNCTGCGACRNICPQKAISGEPKQIHLIDPALCIKCGVCLDTCKFDAIEVS